MEYLKLLPRWLFITFLVIFTGIFGFAVLEGREVTAWPLTIGPKDSISAEYIALEKEYELLSKEYDRLNQELIAAQSKITEQQALSYFPEIVQKQSLRATAAEVHRLIEDLTHSNLALNQLTDRIEGIQGDFLYRILQFHKDTACFGNTLNFTYIDNSPETAECISKHLLAERFLGFLAELEHFNGRVDANTELAKRELIRYQKKKRFKTTGYYGYEVFKWLVIDYSNKV